MTLHAPLPTPCFVVPQKEPCKAYACVCKALYRLHTAPSIQQAEVSAAAVYVGMLMVCQGGLRCTCVSPLDLHYIGIIA